MKKTFSLIFALIAAGSIYAFPGLEHEVPPDAVRGEAVHLEVISVGSGGLQDVTVMYRGLGESKYKSLRLKREGYIFVAEVPTGDITTGQLEYYFAFEEGLGRIGTLPDHNAQINPYRVRIHPARTEQDVNFEVVILSPVAEDVVPDDEVVVAASVLGGETEIDFAYSKLFLDEVEVSGAAVFEEGIVTYVPERLRPGRHYIELHLYNPSGEELLKKEWAFRVVPSGAARPQLNHNWVVFADERYQDLSGETDNYMRGGVRVSGDYGKLDFYGRTILSSEESADRQPAHRFTGELTYHITENDNIYLHGGDFIPYYSPLSFQDKRVRGVQAGYGLLFFSFDFIYGQTIRGIDGYMQGDSLQVNGTYEQNILAFRPGFRFGRNGGWHFNLISAKDKPKSIEYGGNAREVVVAGTDLTLNFDKKRILFEASVQASIRNNDAGLAEIAYDQLVEEDSLFAEKEIYERLFNTVKKINLISLTPGLSPLPSLAMQADLYLKYLNNHLKISYLNIDSEFESPGNPYLLKDIRGLYIFDTIRLLKNQIYVNLFLKKYLNNLVEKEFATDNTEVGGTISYFPFGPYPSVTVGVENYSRSNGVTMQDTVANAYLYMEDNKAIRLTAASSYNIDFARFRNTLSANYMRYNRDDNANPEAVSQYDAFTIGVRTRFPFPLITRLGFNLTKISYGDTLETVNDIMRYSGRIEYRIRNFPVQGMLRPFINISWQQIDLRSGDEMSDTNRLNYSAGLAFQTASYGILTLRFDNIHYSLINNETVNDRIFSARYELHF